MASELAKALAAVQAELPRVEKRSRADTGTYTYDYAELGDVAAAVLPKLGEHGLAFTAWPTLEDGRFVLSYTLMHEGGEERTGTYPLPDKATPQQLGSHITYARRYALCAVTGVAPGGEDNDGAGAAEVQMDRQPVEVNGHEPPADSGEPLAEHGQVTAVQMAYKALGFKPTERDEMLAASEQIIGRELAGPRGKRTHNNLTGGEAQKLADTLRGFEERGDLLAALVEAATP